MKLKIVSKILVFIMLISFVTPLSAFAQDIITYEKAVDIAKQKVSGTLMEIGIDTDDGKLVYEIEIMNSNGNIYDIDVDAYSGKVLKSKLDKKIYNTSAYTSVSITWTQAMNMALDTLKNSTVEKIELKKSRNTVIYEVELRDESGYEVEVYIDANNGKFLLIKGNNVDTSQQASSTSSSSGHKPFNSNNAQAGKSTTSSNSSSAQSKNNQTATGITIQEAEQIALDTVGGKVIKSKSDYDDGILEYDIDVLADNGLIYEFEISASTGKILDMDIDD